jgi:hypothetical protein
VLVVSEEMEDRPDSPRSEELVVGGEVGAEPLVEDIDNLGESGQVFLPGAPRPDRGGAGRRNRFPAARHVELSKVFVSRK